jgi:hypothetical protein
VTPLALVLAQAEKRLTERVIALGERLDSGEDVWSSYVPTVDVLVRLIGDERRPLLTTKGLAEKLQLSPRTVRRLAKRGQLNAEPVRLGARGRSAIRWRA